MGRRKKKQVIEEVEVQTIVKSLAGPRIIYPQLVFDKIMHWVNLSSMEVSGFCRVEVKDNAVRVLDAYLLDEGFSAETTISPAKIMELDERLDSENAPGLLKLWWHSHVDMQVFWSGTDHAAMTQLTEHGWFSYTVFNKKWEKRSAIGLNSPFRFLCDDVPTEIERRYSDDLKLAWDSEYQANKRPESSRAASESWLTRGTRYDIAGSQGSLLLPNGTGPHIESEEEVQQRQYNYLSDWDVAAEFRDLQTMGHTETEIGAILGERNKERAKTYLAEIESSYQRNYHGY